MRNIWCIIRLQVAQDIAKVINKMAIYICIGHALNIEYFAQFVNNKTQYFANLKEG
jgi:hypothetical protein